VRSPWTPPPLPGSDEAVDVLGDTDGEGVPARTDDSPSQLSQATDPVASAKHDTTPIRPATPAVRLRKPPTPPPLPSQRSPTVGTTVAITLAIAVPVSMAVGALMMFFLLTALRSG
jgi:hypothetical protein